MRKVETLRAFRRQHGRCHGCIIVYRLDGIVEATCTHCKKTMLFGEPHPEIVGSLAPLKKKRPGKGHSRRRRNIWDPQ